MYLLRFGAHSLLYGGVTTITLVTPCMTGNKSFMAIVSVCTVYTGSLTCIEVLGGRMQGLGVVIYDFGASHGMAPRLERSPLQKGNDPSSSSAGRSVM